MEHLAYLHLHIMIFPILSCKKMDILFLNVATRNAAHQVQQVNLSKKETILHVQEKKNYITY